MSVITASGVNPSVLHLNSPVTVEFKNEDTVPHQIVDAPQLGSAPCPEINGVGMLQPSQNGSVSLAEHEVVCGYEDALNPSNQAFQGLIVLH